MELKYEHSAMVDEKLVSEKPMFIAPLFILENWCKIAPK
jgi:hypothetical protein